MHTYNSLMLEDFKTYLLEMELSDRTISKYIHDVKLFEEYLGNRTIFHKSDVLLFKQQILKRYRITSVNSILIALNRFFKYEEWYDCVVKCVKQQKVSFRLEEHVLTKEEYYHLLEQAKARKRIRLFLLMQTIASTGIRIGELSFITVEALHTGIADVLLKGKHRRVILPDGLRMLLKQYVKEKEITAGPVFLSNRGNPLDRNNIWHEMKQLSKGTDIPASKVHPHSFRHLFAVTHYETFHDLALLADILGHSDINTTRIYVRNTSDYQAKSLDSLGLVLEK